MALFSHAGQSACRMRAALACRRLLVTAASRAEPRAAIGSSPAFFGGQLRHARTIKSRQAQPKGGPPPDYDEDEVAGPADVPAEILDEWDKDEEVQDFLRMFASEELRGKGLLSHRDV